MVAALRHRVRRFLRWSQTAWSVFGVTLIALGLTETGLRLGFALNDHWRLRPQPGPRVLAEGYGGASWPVEHYRELESLAERWEPYVYFRLKPFKGKTISISNEGLRRVWRPPSRSAGAGPARGPVRILMLGGSVLWGFGARDDQTVPSVLARRLYEQAAGVDAQIRNLAQIGYVSTQETIALLRELQAGRRFDLVVFLDGVNDAASAFLEGEAGLSTNEGNRRREFCLLKEPRRLGGALLLQTIEGSGSYRFARGARRWIVGGPSAAAGPAMSDAARTELAREVVRRYEANVEMVERLGRAYGFRPLFFWQPVVFTKKAKTSFEREEAAKFAWAAPMFHDVNERLRASAALRGRPAFHDLSSMFDDAENLVFIDYCHLTESAYARIADAIAADARKALGLSPAAITAGPAVPLEKGTPLAQRDRRPDCPVLLSTAGPAGPPSKMGPSPSPWPFRDNHRQNPWPRPGTLTKGQPIDMRGGGR